MIQIEEKNIIEAAEKGMDEFLKVFSDAYIKVMEDGMTSANMDKLNGYQHTILAFRYFTDEIREGGFIQLIQNGYGGYIFDNPTAKALRQMGARDLSKILYKAKEIYDANKQDLERETTEEEFMAMYEQYEEFDELEEKYMEIEEEQTFIIAQYVDDNIEDFATIIK